ncbi:hypothetical protein AGMMS50218_10960 [Actinomycetota bacterium]|nr:hypothetical protein AGMMS50218_10960 [Actinomycetota bacterium]
MVRQDRGGSTSWRWAWWCAGAAALVVVVLSALGAAVLVDRWIGSWDTEPVLVTAAQREALGYEQPAGKLHAALHWLAVQHREEIYASVEPVVEEALGREVAFVGIVAPKLYWVPILDSFRPADWGQYLEVRFRTEGEPVVASWVTVTLSPDGTVDSISQIKGVDLQDMIVEGLYRIAHRERITQMREYLATTYPEFTALPQGYVESLSSTDPMFQFGDYYERGSSDEIQDPEAAIYQEYQANPSRTEAEWLELFEQVYGDREMSINVHLMLADPGKVLTERASRQIANDVRSNPLFVGFGDWIVFTYSNRMLRGETGPYIHHRQFILQANRDRPRWAVSAWEDGFSSWRETDELRRPPREGARDGRAP